MDIYDNTYVTQPFIIYVCQRFLPVLMSVTFHPLCAKNNEALLQNFPDIKKSSDFIATYMLYHYGINSE